ncbi:MAG: CDP-diacylglycerol--serine O-phosphatidyltransferase [Flavobacteriaceae bacterium]
MKRFFPPPFQPEDQPKGKRPLRRLREVPLRILVPNMITLFALYAGLTSIRMTLESRFEYAAALIVLAGVLDALDGRAARMLKASSRFGAELDSLADFVNFGVAPALLLYAWSLDTLGSIGWIAAILFAMSIVLRLARFNVMLDEDRPDWMGNFFVGMPAPAAAGTLLLPLYLEFVGVDHNDGMAWLILVYVVLVAYLTVSRIPTYSGKKVGIRIPRDYVVPVFGAVLLFVAFAASYFWIVLTVLAIAYLALLPVGFVRYRQLERHHAEAAATAGGKGAS